MVTGWLYLVERKPISFSVRVVGILKVTAFIEDGYDPYVCVLSVDSVGLTILVHTTCSLHISLHAQTCIYKQTHIVGTDKSLSGLCFLIFFEVIVGTDL